MSDIIEFWIITFKRHSGELVSIECPWPSEPSREYAAQMVRNFEFPGVWIIPDTPRDEREPTIYQLGKYGIEIIDVKRKIMQDDEG